MIKPQGGAGTPHRFFDWMSEVKNIEDLNRLKGLKGVRKQYLAVVSILYVACKKERHSF